MQATERDFGAKKVSLCTEGAADMGNILKVAEHAIATSYAEHMLADSTIPEPYRTMAESVITKNILVEISSRLSVDETQIEECPNQDTSHLHVDVSYNKSLLVLESPT